MAKYKVQRIENEEFDGIMSVVKYIDTTTEGEFKQWLNMMYGENYDIIRHDKHTAYLYHLCDITDVLKISCKAPIKVAWIRETFSDYFKTI